jgi:hypothetical protein
MCRGRLARAWRGHLALGRFFFFFSFAAKKEQKKKRADETSAARAGKMPATRCTKRAPLFSFCPV